MTEPDSSEAQVVPVYEGQKQQGFSLAEDDQSAPEMAVDMGEVFRPKNLQSRKDQRFRRMSGRRSMTRSARKRGRYIQSRLAPGERDDIAFDATFRQAAPYQIERQRDDVAFAISNQDFHRKLRVRRAANLVLFVVDASWSMAAAARMEATKGAVMSLLVDAYQRRDRVGVVVFQKDIAWEALPFTSSVELARRVLRNIPVGGKTPLSAGLFLAYKMISRELRFNPELMPLMIVLTDGAANVSMTGRPAFEESKRIAGMIQQLGVRSVVVNMEQITFDRGLAQDLACSLEGPCYNLRELKAQALYHTVQRELSLRNNMNSGRGA